MEHKLERKYKGDREMRTITPTCSCGWIGRGYAAYNDYQHSMVKEQENQHLDEANNE